MIKNRKEHFDTLRRIAETDDISQPLLQQAAQLTLNSPTVKIEPAQFEDLFELHLGKYEEYKRIVGEDEERQEALLRTISDVNAEFLASRKGNAGLLKREKVLQNLEQAYQRFSEVKSNLREGIKFYNDLGRKLLEFRDNCRSYSLARRMEAKDHSSELTAAVAGLSLTGQPPRQLNTGYTPQQPQQPQQPASPGVWGRSSRSAPAPGGAWNPDLGINFGERR